MFPNISVIIMNFCKTTFHSASFKDLKAERLDDGKDRMLPKVLTGSSKCDFYYTSIFLWKHFSSKGIRRSQQTKVYMNLPYTTLGIMQMGKIVM